MGARWTLGRIFRFHAANQLADYLADLRTSGRLGRGAQSPKQPEAKAMPGHHGVRLDDQQGIRSVRPPTAERRPEQSVQVS